MNGVFIEQRCGSSDRSVEALDKSAHHRSIFVGCERKHLVEGCQVECKWLFDEDRNACLQHRCHAFDSGLSTGSDDHRIGC